MAEGDVVTAINEKKISFRDDLDIIEFVGSFKPGDMIRFHLIRSGKEKAIAIRAGELPPEYEKASRESLQRAREQRKSRDAHAAGGDR
jgi:S1-C subfamily serine protease